LGGLLGDLAWVFFIFCNVRRTLMAAIVLQGCVSTELPTHYQQQKANVLRIGKDPKRRYVGAAGENANKLLPCQAALDMGAMRSSGPAHGEANDDC
jgi:hypothetical protein